MTLTASSVSYMLSSMNSHMVDMLSTDSKYSLVCSRDFIDFCVNFLHRSGLLCRWNDVTFKWEVFK